MREARRQLAYTSLQVATIGCALGFADPATEAAPRADRRAVAAGVPRASAGRPRPGRRETRRSGWPPSTRPWCRPLPVLRRRGCVAVLDDRLPPAAVSRRAAAADTAVMNTPLRPVEVQPVRLRVRTGQRAARGRFSPGIALDRHSRALELSGLRLRQARLPDGAGRRASLSVPRSPAAPARTSLGATPNQRRKVRLKFDVSVAEARRDRSDAVARVLQVPQRAGGALVEQRLVARALVLQAPDQCGETANSAASAASVGAPRPPRRAGARARVAPC